MRVSSRSTEDIMAAIVSECSHPISWTDLYRVIVEVKELCARATFNKYLKSLCEGPEPRIVRYPPPGTSSRSTFYVAKENEAELEPYKAIIDEIPQEDIRTDDVSSSNVVVDYVIRSAHQILDEISLSNHNEVDLMSISRRSLVLDNAVDQLRPFHEALPKSWVIARVERIIDELELSSKMGKKRPRIQPRALILEMVSWQDHWLAVLQVLETKKNGEDRRP